MNSDEGLVFLHSLQRGIMNANYENERAPWDEREVHPSEKFFAGFAAPLRPYGEMSVDKQQAQELIHEYSGVFEEGIRFALALDQYKPPENSFEVTDYEKRDSFEITDYDSGGFTINER